MALLEPGPDDPNGLASRRSPTDTLAANVFRGIFVSSNSGSLSAFGSGSNRNQNTIYGTSTAAHTSPLYVSGSYTYYKTNHFGLTVGNTTTASGIWTLGYGMQGPDHVPGASVNQASVILFKQSQSKANTQIFSASFVYTWARTMGGN
jgi:hypothetical protein